MSAYTQATDWYVRGNGRKYTTTAPLSWELGVKNSGYIVTVPIRFVFDVSIPWFAVPFFSPHNPKYLKAACIHDYLLHVRKWDRVEAASVFNSALRADKINGLERWIMWQAVAHRKYK